MKRSDILLNSIIYEIRLLLSLEGSGGDFFNNPTSRAIVETKGGMYPVGEP